MLAKVRDDLIRQMFESDMDLLRRKGHDYSGEEDCLGNLREYGIQGILIRLTDKLCRMKSLMHFRKTGTNFRYATLEEKIAYDLPKKDIAFTTTKYSSVPMCQDESFQDTLRDLSNYAYLARVLLWEQRQKEEDEVHEE